MRVLLADDHTLVRAGLRELLENVDGVEVIAETGSGEEAVRLAESLSPDIALLDIAMEDMTGIAAAGQIRDRAPAVKCIVLSMHASPDFVRAALRAGVRGYLVKDAATGELPLAILAVAAGDLYLSPKVSTQVVAGWIHRSVESLSPLQRLTARQCEVLTRIGRGQSTKQIAYDLGLSAKTVENHRARIMQRVGIRDLAGLVRLAIRTGLVSPDP